MPYTYELFVCKHAKYSGQTCFNVLERINLQKGKPDNLHFIRNWSFKSNTLKNVKSRDISL